MRIYCIIQYTTSDHCAPVEQDLVEIDLEVGTEANFSKQNNTRHNCSESLVDSTVTLEHVQSSTSVMLQLNQ